MHYVTIHLAPVDIAICTQIIDVVFIVVTAIKLVNASATSFGLQLVMNCYRRVENIEIASLIYKAVSSVVN